MDDESKHTELGILAKQIESLLNLNIGDGERLKFIQTTLRNQNDIPKHEKKYIQDLIQNSKRGENYQEGLEKNLEELKTQSKLSEYKKSQGITFVLSLFLLAGSFYLGKHLRGSIILVIFALSFIFASVFTYVLTDRPHSINGDPTTVIAVSVASAFISICAWLFSILDSHDQCKKYNKFLLEYGEKPPNDTNKKIAILILLGIPAILFLLPQINNI